MAEAHPPGKPDPDYAEADGSPGAGGLGTARDRTDEALNQGHAIEPGSQDLYEEDEFLAAGWDATSEVGSTSVSSNVYKHEFEHGRRYHSYKHGRYPVPNDDQEQYREDMKHALMMELTVGGNGPLRRWVPPPQGANTAQDGRLLYAPIGDSPQKILDMGTGTGGPPAHSPSGAPRLTPSQGYGP